MATATERRAKQGLVAGKGDAANVKTLVATVELASGSAAGTTIDFGKIPADARILGASKVHWDQLDATNAATLDIGLVAVDGNITSDPDALTDGLDVTTAGSGAVVKDAADYARKAYEHVSGQSSDPGGVLQVQGVTADDATDTTGTVTLELLYVMD